MSSYWQWLISYNLAFEIDDSKQSILFWEISDFGKIILIFLCIINGVQYDFNPILSDGSILGLSSLKIQSFHWLPGDLIIEVQIYDHSIVRFPVINLSVRLFLGWMLALSVQKIPKVLRLFLADNLVVLYEINFIFLHEESHALLELNQSLKESFKCSLISSLYLSNFFDMTKLYPSFPKNLTNLYMYKDIKLMRLNLSF